LIGCDPGHANCARVAAAWIGPPARRAIAGPGAAPEIFRYGAHHGEEPPISATRGSGTVFFSRCTMKCLYCQNFPWSQEGHGERYSTDGLAAILMTLRQEGCQQLEPGEPHTLAAPDSGGCERR